MAETSRTIVGRTGLMLNDFSIANIIAFTVSDDSMDEPTAISVGWDSIGSAENVIETYSVFVPTDPTNPNDVPINYGALDANSNNIPDNADLNLMMNRLQVSSGGEITVRNNLVNYLSTQRMKPVFLTYEALVIANDTDLMMALANSPSRYSAAGIEYGGLSRDVRERLGLIEADEDLMTRLNIDPMETIERLAAFGVRDVDYSYRIGNNNEVIIGGGITHTVFPMLSDTEGPLYIGKYNRLETRWEPFERGTDDTWYGIQWPVPTDPNNACPTDVEVYKNRHPLGQDFVAGDYNCIMLVITDGGFYDSSGLDGRVVDDMAATVNENLPQATVEEGGGGRPSTGGGGGGGRPGGGGGGATDISDVILLLMALSLLAITIRRTRKNNVIEQT